MAGHEGLMADQSRSAQPEGVGPEGGGTRTFISHRARRHLV